MCLIMKLSFMDYTRLFKQRECCICKCYNRTQDERLFSLTVSCDSIETKSTKKLDYFPDNEFICITFKKVKNEDDAVHISTSSPQFYVIEM